MRGLDGGKTWQSWSYLTDLKGTFPRGNEPSFGTLVFSADPATFDGVFAYGRSTNMGLVPGAAILRTTDGGESWTLRAELHGDQTELFASSAQSLDTAYMAGGPFVLSTTNGWKSSQRHDLPFKNFRASAIAVSPGAPGTVLLYALAAAGVQVTTTGRQ